MVHVPLTGEHARTPKPKQTEQDSQASTMTPDADNASSSAAPGSDHTSTLPGTAAAGGGGWYQMPKSLFDAALGSAMSPSAKLVLLDVHRWTHGHHQHLAAPLSISYLVECCGLSERQVQRVLKDQLLPEGVLLEEGKPTRTDSRVLAIEMDQQKWGKWAPTGEGQNPPPSPFERSDWVVTSCPLEGSAGVVTSCPPKKTGRSREEKEERAAGQGKESYRAEISSSPIEPKAETLLAGMTSLLESEEGLCFESISSFEESLPFVCQAEEVLTEVDSLLVEAIGGALANEVYEEMCEACFAASPSLRCAERSDVCRAAAEKLEMRLTEANIRNKRRYVKKILDEPNPGPAHLIGWDRYQELAWLSGTFGSSWFAKNLVESLEEL